MAKGIDWKYLGALGALGALDAFKADTFPATGSKRADVVSFIFNDGQWGYVLHAVGNEAQR
jgi:hypothetical protein